MFLPRRQKCSQAYHREPQYSMCRGIPRSSVKKAYGRFWFPAAFGRRSFRVRMSLSGYAPFNVELSGNGLVPRQVFQRMTPLSSFFQGARVELGDEARGEDGNRNVVSIKEIDEPPNSNSSSEFAPGHLHDGLVFQYAEELGIKVDREIHGQPDSLWVLKVPYVQVSARFPGPLAFVESWFILFS